MDNKHLIKSIPYYFQYSGINPLKLFNVKNATWNNEGKGFIVTILEMGNIVKE